MLLSVGTIIADCAADPGGEVWAQADVGDLFCFDVCDLSLWACLCLLPARGALFWFMICLFFLGIGGANFAMYRSGAGQYPTECRPARCIFNSVAALPARVITFL